MHQKILDRISWLLCADPWVEYNTRLNLLGEPPDKPEVVRSRERMVSHPLVKKLIDELSGWPGTVLNSHKSAGQHFHKLSFLADIGLTVNDPGVGKIAGRIFEHVSAEGPFQLPMNISESHGGDGSEKFAWALCDAPITVYSLAKMGMNQDQRVIKAKNYLVQLGRENGYPCTVSKELGDWRGPGRKSDPCPYATLVMLKLLSLDEKDRNSEFAAKSVETLLNLWENSLILKPYIFYMGTDFRKLKAPFVWYDILHVAHVLSQFETASGDPRFFNMIEVIRSKEDTDGRYTPVSVWQAWKEWEFGQKKSPSPWLTYLATVIQTRAKQNR